jgi:hypothetical protein
MDYTTVLVSVVTVMIAKCHLVKVIIKKWVQYTYKSSDNFETVTLWN